jgi:hypothetical protein
VPRVFRWYVGMVNGRVRCTFRSPVFNNQSVVMVSASEGREPGRTDDPFRFVGEANVTVHNIAPAETRDPQGGDNAVPAHVGFILTVDWYEPRPIWVDIALFDEFPWGYSKSD